MKLFSKAMLRKISILTVMMFILSTGGTYAQMPEVSIPVNAAQPVDISILNNVLPELNNLQSNLRTAQSTLATLEKVSTPLYNQIAPTNMQAMSIGERIQAILGNAKSLLGNTMKSSGTEARQILAAGGSVTDLTYDQQLAYGVEQLNVQSAKLQTNGKFSASAEKLKAVLALVKGAIQSIVTAIRAKIFAAGQKVGLIDKSKTFEEGKVKDGAGNSKMAPSAAADVQFSDSFSGKLAKGVSEGTQNAKASLKNSFSFSNLAMTTTVAIGTNLAIDMIHGEKPSFSKAVKQVASLEFAGSVMGSALGAAGGQFTSTLVKTFIPGPVGALVGSVIPVMFASASGQMGANLVSGLKNGEFSVAKAFKQIDKVDLVGSSIGSTIGMALGAPIPIVGPIIGGIVGGMLGSKVAKWVASFARGGKVSTVFSRGTNASAQQQTQQTSSGFPVSIGSIAGSGRGTGPVVMGSSEAVSANFSVSGDVATRLADVEKKYYDTYLQYNRMVEKNDQEGAKKIFEELKKYSDEYATLKKAVKTGN